MTNNKLFLLLGTSMSFIPTLTFAQCVATQDCMTLGYTETSCSGGKGIKCPFGNKWACLPTKDSICKEEGFTLACNGTGQIGSGDSCSGLYRKCSCDSAYQYTCSGAGYSGGSGASCDGKYTVCTCSSGYEWDGSSCTAACKNTYTKEKCDKSCKPVSGTPCYKDGIAYYPSCGESRCNKFDRFNMCMNGKCNISSSSGVCDNGDCSDDEAWCYRYFSSSYFSSFPEYGYILGVCYVFEY